MYGKKEAKMTQGMAIVSMLVLHLFCRKGTDVLGNPLIWLNSDTPLVYVFGFFAEICVPIYCFCAGYAQFIMYQSGKLSYKSNLKRAFNLLLNYWVVLVIFSVIAIIKGPDCGITVTPLNFLQNVFLLGSYNGAWWFLHTYVFLMLIPSVIMLAFPKKVNPYIGIGICIVFRMGWTLAGKFGILSFLNILTGNPNFVISYISTEICNLIGVLPAYFIGAFICKGDLITKTKVKYESLIHGKWQKPVLLLIFIILITVNYLVHKAILSIICALITFILFNTWEKGKAAEKVFLFLGNHSTNIWLSHMFFYVSIFPGLVAIVQNPVFMLLFMVLLCVITSYVVKLVLYLVKNPFTKKTYP